MEKGKLIFKVVGYEDTYYKKHFKTSSFVISFIALVVVYFLVFIILSDKIYNSSDDNNILFYILIFLCGMILSSGFVKRIGKKHVIRNSYLYIYENQIEGMAVVESSALKNPSLERFTLSFKDISNVSYSEQYVIIYAPWKTYKIFAFEKENEIIRIINRQKNPDSIATD